MKNKLGLPKDLTMKNARHTPANILKSKEVSREFIKDILGHQSIVTTEHYLEGMEDLQHEAIMKNLINEKESVYRVA